MREVGNGLLIRRPPQGGLCGLSTVQDRPAELATLRKVQGEFRGHPSCLAVIGLLIPEAHALMYGHALADRHALVQHFLIECMHETIPCPYGRVWPLDQPAFLEKMSVSGKFCTMLFNNLQL